MIVTTGDLGRSSERSSISSAPAVVSSRGSTSTENPNRSAARLTTSTSRGWLIVVMIPILINCLMTSLGLIEILSANSLTVIVSAILTVVRRGAGEGSCSTSPAWACGSGIGGVTVTIGSGTLTVGGGIGVFAGASFKPAGAPETLGGGANGAADGCSSTAVARDG